jgi:peptidoglycan hydrolase-like protein with peptidoglycan-binding domain
VRPPRIALGAAALVLVAGAVTVAALGLGGRDPRPASGVTDRPPATTTVTRTTLSQTQQVNGVLGYGRATTVTVRGQGTITWLPDPGATVSRGHAVLRRDDLPVPLFYGDLPLYRQLRPGDSGADVAEVERNLAALRYSGFTVDDDYTSATADAVRRWQSDAGLPASRRTGAVSPTDVVVAPGMIRVASVAASPGDPASGRLLTYTGTTRSVDVPLDVALQGLAKPGVAATVTLPDNRDVDGTVSAVGTVASPGSANGPATIDVTVSIADQSHLGTLDEAPVDVTLVAARAQDVLAVPVAALVALAEGGYGVQVVDGTGTRYVAVRTGMFAGGRVEISGPGIGAGTVVGEPK